MTYPDNKYHDASRRLKSVRFRVIPQRRLESEAWSGSFLFGFIKDPTNKTTVSSENAHSDRKCELPQKKKKKDKHTCDICFVNSWRFSD